MTARARLRVMVLSCILLMVAAACRGPDGGPRFLIETAGRPPTPAAARGLFRPGRALRVAVPAGVHDRVETLLAGTATDPRVPPLLVGERDDAEVRVAVTVDGTAPVIRRWAVAAAAARIDLDDVPAATVTRAAAHGPLYVDQQHAALVSLLFAEHDGLRPVAGATLPARLAADPDALALVPADTATVRVHTLSVDGVDPVRVEGDLAAYQLVTRARVEAARPGKEPAALAAVLSEALEQPQRAPLRVTFTGDLIPTRCVYDQMRRAGDWAAPFRLVAERLSGADLTIGSLDAAISDKGAPIGCRETFNLMAPPEVVQGLRLAGFDAITVAANHAKDCGSTGFCGDAAMLDTIANLRAAGIQSFGSGHDLAEARRPAILTAGGVRFAFLGYDDIAAYYHADEHAAGTAGLDLATLAEDVKAAGAAADVVIVMPHWGEEYTPTPTARQRAAAQIAVQAGATLVVGNHPHVVQAAAPAGDAYVAFALGNFVFDQDWSVETTQGVVLEATFAGPRLAGVRLLPTRIVNRLQPVFLGPVDGRPILKRMMDAAARLGE